MNSAVIGVGSNINPESNVILAEKEVGLLGILKNKSDFVYTRPLLYENQNEFLNGIFHIETQHEKLELKKLLKDIESKLGRIRGANKNGPRTIDLDILVFNNQIEDHDVFHRDFFKNPIVDLFPNLFPVLSCENYINNFDSIHKIIELIKSTLPNNLISIFGAGQWFNDEEPATNNIDIIAIVKDADKQFNLLIIKELEALQLNVISELPVKVTLILLSELAEKSQEKDTQVLFTQQFSSYKLLYGQEWSF